MEITYFALALGAAILGLASRAAMKRYLKRETGRAGAYLLEADFWKATSDRPSARALLAAEIASWAATVLSVLAAASGILGP